MFEFIKSALVDEWKNVTLTSYTVYGLYAIIGCLIAPEILFHIFGLDTNPLVWGFLIAFFCILTLVGRLIKQPEATKLRRRFIIGVMALVTLFVALPALAQAKTSPAFDDAAFTLISKWEGENKKGNLHASYKDIVGVWTICYGHTRTAGPNQYKTDKDCRDLLIEEIREYREGLHVHFSPETKRFRLTPLRDAAYTSLAYNVGIRAAGRSTATRRLNRGNITGGCEALTWWNRAGGRVVRGLVRRRSEERRYCLGI